jgi:hypothetical protein
MREQATPKLESSERLWEATFRNAPADVIADSVERRTFLSVQPQSLDCCNASRHQTFAVRFFLEKRPRSNNSAEMPRRPSWIATAEQPALRQ